MLYLIHGTDNKKRILARKKILAKVGQNFFLPVEIQKENLHLLENYLQAQSLFSNLSSGLADEKILINIFDILTKEDSRKFIYENLEKLISSQNIFILDEPFALKTSIDKVTKLVGRENVFDCSEIKAVKDIEPFKFCDLIEARDKKNAWLEWKKIYEEWGNQEEQALHGALWWKWKMIWQNFLNGRKVNYSKIEIENMAKEISLMSMQANNGEIDLMRTIEKLILKI